MTPDMKKRLMWIAWRELLVLVCCVFIYYEAGIVTAITVLMISLGIECNTLLFVNNKTEIEILQLKFKLLAKFKSGKINESVDENNN